MGKKSKQKQPAYGPEGKGRMEAEEQGVTTTPTDQPGEGRFPEKKQSFTAADSVISGLKPDPAKTVETARKRLALRPTAVVSEKDSTELTGGAPSQDGLNAFAVRNAAGAVSASLTDDQSKKPYTSGRVQSDSRFARKTTVENFDINNAACMQDEPEFDQLAPLHKSADKLVGYSGRAQFTSSRGKKNAGSVPGDLLYFRGLQLHEHHATIPTCGQFTSNIPAESDYPTRRAVKNFSSTINGTGDEPAGWEDIPNPMRKGNYVPKAFKFSIVGGKVANPRFVEDRFIVDVPIANRERVNANWQTDSNIVTKTTRKLQTMLGRETAEDWSPLGLAIDQPFENQMLMHDIEATTGALCGLAERTMTSALAYQAMNKVKLDGAKPTTPAIEMFLGGIGDLSRSIKPEDPIASLPFVRDFKSNSTTPGSIFEPSLYKVGSAALFMALEDSSVKKYVTKATFFNYPKTLKFLLQRGENNFRVLRAKKDVVYAWNVEDDYSTEDGNYSSALPINSCSFISVQNPMPLNKFLEGWSMDNVSSANPSGCATIFAYKYKDLRLPYYYRLSHPVVEGIMEYLVKHVDLLCDAFRSTDVDEITIPVLYNSKYPTAWSCLLLAASKYIIQRRSVLLNDFFYAYSQLKEYPFSDLEELSTLNVKYSTQKKADSFKEPIVQGKLGDPGFLRTYFGEHYQCLATDDPVAGVSKVLMAMPWFMNETNFTKTYARRSGYLRDDGVATFSMPAVEVGCGHAYLDRLLAMDPRDVRLALDVPVDILYPVESDDSDPNSDVTYRSINRTGAGVNEDTINSNIKVYAMRTDLLSDGRVAVEYINTPTQTLIPTKAAVMCMPREIGWFYPRFRVAPIISSITVDNTQGNPAVTLTNAGTYKMSSPLDGSMSDSLIAYAATATGNEGFTIDRASALEQYFCRLYADRDTAIVASQVEFLNRTGYVPSFGLLISDTSALAGLNVPVDALPFCFYGLNGSNKATIDVAPSASFKLKTSSRWLRMMLGRECYFSNPFEILAAPGKSTEKFPGGGIPCDPLEAAYIFGYAGMLAADYMQDILQRADKMMQLDVDYIIDDWKEASPAFRR